MRRSLLIISTVASIFSSFPNSEVIGSNTKIKFNFIKTDILNLRDNLINTLPKKTPPPTISYNSPNTYTVGMTIPNLVPISTGVSAQGYNNPITVTSGTVIPFGVAVDASGNVYVGDYGNGAVKEIPVGGGPIITLGSGFVKPSNVAVDVAGNVYCAVQGDGSIQEFPVTGGGPIGIGSGFSSPAGVAVDTAGNVYVADSQNNTIKEIPAGGGPIISLGSGIINPQGVAVDAAGNVYVANYNTGTILEILAAGGNTITLGSGFVLPTSVAVDAGGNVFVANSGANAIDEIPAGGGAPIAIGSGFASPSGVATDAFGDIYVADSGNDAIKEMIPAGGYYISTPLPPGLSFNNSTGVISGTPTAPSPTTNYTVTAYNNIGSTSTIVTITVIPTAVPSITATVSTGTITACAGSASASPLIEQFYVSGANLADSITATAPVGFEVSLSSVSGYGSTVSIPQIGGIVDSILVYVRSAASAPSGNISGNVVLSSMGATSQNVPVTGIVNALPAVDSVPNQIVLNGSLTAAVNFIGTGNTFNWVNNTPSIGLAASGTGNISPFTAINTGNTPVTATITVTPVSAGFAYISNWGSNNVSVINTSTDSVIATIPVGTNPSGVSVSPDNSKVYVANSGSNNVSVINTSTDSVIATIPVGSNPLSVSFSPDGTRVYVTNSGSNSISVINTTTYAVTTFTGTGISNPQNVAVSPDGSKAYVTENGSGSVSVINTANDSIIATVGVGACPAGILVSPDGRMVYEPNYCSSSVSVINTATDSVVATIPVGSDPAQVTISADGTMIYVSNHGSGSVSIINTANDSIIATVGVGIQPAGVSFSPGNDMVYVTNAGSNNVSVINTVTNTVVTTIPVGSAPSTAGNFVTSGLSCTSTSVRFTITVNPSTDTIIATVSTGTISACAGTVSAGPLIQQFYVLGRYLTANITATAPTGFELSLTAGSGYGDTVTIPQTSGIVDSILVYVRSAASAPAGTISGNVMLSSTGATSQNVAVTGIINPDVTPSVNITATTNNICPGTPVTFTATPTNGGTNPSYKWYKGTAYEGGGDTYTDPGTTAGNITCVMTSSLTCVTSTTDTSNAISLSVTPPVTPLVTIAITSGTNPACLGTPVIFTATPTNGGNPSYKWYKGTAYEGGGDTYTDPGTTAGNITCVMTSSLPCTSPVASSTLSMVIYPLPTVTFIPDTVYTTSGGYVQLNPIITGTIEKYLWSPATGLSSASTENPDASVVNTVTYQLQVTSDHGCSATENITVLPGLPLQMPNAFTPNGDGRNDVFRIPPGVQFTLQEFDIFNSWGNRIFTTNDMTKGWDGTYKGLPADAGVYVYMITGKNPAGRAVFLKGIVVLIR